MTRENKVKINWIWDNSTPNEVKCEECNKTIRGIESYKAIADGKVYYVCKDCYEQLRDEKN